MGKIKKGDTLIFISRVPKAEDLIIKVASIENGKIVDENGTEYLTSDLLVNYHKFYRVHTPSVKKPT